MTDYVVRREHDGVYLDIDGTAHQVDTVSITRGLCRPTRLEVVTLDGQKQGTDLTLLDTLRAVGSWRQPAEIGTDPDRIIDGEIVRKEIGA